MNYVKVSVSAEPVIPLETLKGRLDVQDTGDATFDAVQDSNIEAALATAVDYVEKQTHLTLRPTVFRLDMRDWCVAVGHGGRQYGWSCCYGLNLERVPVQSVDGIEYLGRGEITYDDLPGADWEFQRVPAGGIIHLTDGVSLPSLESRWNAVQITFTAGFEIAGLTGSGDDPELALPDGLRGALTLLAGHFYTNRDAVGTERQYQVELGADALMTAFRLYR